MKDFKLDNEPKIASGLKTPDGYFDAFSERMMAQLPKSQPKVIPLYKSKKTWYYAAAAVLALSLSIPVYNNYRSDQAAIDSAALEHYIAYNSTITQEEIVDLMNQEDLDKMKIELNVDDAALEDAVRNNINFEEYLID